MKKEIPILFSTPMVQAILAGKKTITRRIVKWPQKCPTHHIEIGDGYFGPIIGWAKWQIGDVLYVRESFNWDYKKYPERTEKYFFYKATTNDDFLASGEKWKPSIHLPKSASRIWLEVQSVKAERLHEITEDDARAEGVGNRNIFRSLWQQINGNWDANPWVWVISFKVLSTTGKPAEL